ncbi:hypothetical protein Tco_0762790 [Tanacetum coccineum]
MGEGGIESFQEPVERKDLNSMKESREPGCMPVSYDQVEWHKICLLAYVEILIPPHSCVGEVSWLFQARAKRARSDPGSEPEFVG